MTYSMTQNHKNNIKHSMLGIKHTKERCENISKSLIGKKKTEQIKNNMSLGKLKYYTTHKNSRYGTITSEETKLKLRDAQINYIKKHEHFVGPNIGNYEKQILDILQNKIGFSIKRGFYINGYFLDGYCQELNLAIEVDEEHHYKNNMLRQKDVDKQNNIMKALNCDLIRIRVSDVMFDDKIKLGVLTC